MRCCRCTSSGRAARTPAGAAQHGLPWLHSWLRMLASSSMHSGCSAMLSGCMRTAHEHYWPRLCGVCSINCRHPFTARRQLARRTCRGRWHGLQDCSQLSARSKLPAPERNFCNVLTHPVQLQWIPTVSAQKCVEALPPMAAQQRLIPQWQEWQSDAA